MYYKLINNVRIILIKIIQNSKSGHPGMPLGISDVIITLWYIFYKNNFNNIKNINKDKMVISNGHGAIIQYILLYLSKIYKLNDIKNFRKIFSKCPAHPELCDVIDASTGPLGQGIGIGIGIGLKNQLFKNKFNKKINLFFNKVWIFCGDGCMMEGVSSESTSFCGSLNIDNIILLYDKNYISIDGLVKNFFLDDIRNKFISINWNVIGPINGHCYLSIFKSFIKAKNSKFPTLIIFETIIGFLSPEKSFNESVHGSIFNKIEYKSILKNFCINYTFKKKIFFDLKKKFLIYYKKNYNNNYIELLRIYSKIIPNFNIFTLYFKNYKKALNKSTRFISSLILSDFYSINEFIGGSADLSSSNLTKNNKINSIIKKSFKNRYLNFGVREFTMCLINYGLSSDKIGISFCSTFLVFSNYMYSAIRNIAMSKIKNIFIFTHDSISVGEDGPSHQPIEQLQSLRIIPRFYVFRPYNYIELLISWILTLKLKKNSSSIILSRQNFLNNNLLQINIKKIIKGGYSFYIIKEKLDLLIISNGSDLEICFQCSLKLKKYFKINIISIFCEKLFNKQNKHYKNEMLNCEKILVVESSNDDIWKKYNFKKMFLINIKKYGKSGSESEIKKYFNFTIKNLIKISLFIIKI